jgi:hypothetical protein
MTKTIKKVEAKSEGLATFLKSDPKLVALIKKYGKRKPRKGRKGGKRG